MAKRKGKKRENLPSDSGNQPVGYCNPPVEYRFKPGQVGNPAGRPAAGATIREWINRLAQEELTEAGLREVARDTKHPWTKRCAAERILRTLEAGDLADFAGLFRGEISLEDLRGMGINTEVVKKFKQKTRKQMVGHGEDEHIEEVIEREIELHDRAGADFDRIMDRTAGKPGQVVEITGAGGGPLKTEITRHVIADAESTQLANALAKRMASHAVGNGESSN
jgi:hypothetical protein